MKIKQRLDKDTGLSVLSIELDKGAELDYVDASIIADGIPPFARCKYRVRRSQTTLTYVLGRCDTPLNKCFAGSLDFPQIARMLTDFLDMAVACETNSLSMQRVMFDPTRIFCDKGTGALMFIFVPSRSFIDVNHDVRSTLLYLCRQAKTLHRDDAAILKDVEDGLLRSAMFTSVDYRSILQRVGILRSGDDLQGFGSASGASISFSDSQPIDDHTASFGFDFVQEQTTQQDALLGAQLNEDRSSKPISFSLIRQGTGTGWKLTEGVYTVGRAENCSIVLDGSDGVSRIHATFKVSDSEITVRDEGSTNGVIVNGERIDPDHDTTLEPEDIVIMGTERFVIRP